MFDRIIIWYNLFMLNIFKKEILKKEGEKTNTPKAIIIVGRSGCGKGTQADLLISHLCLNSDKFCRTLHVESGTLLRDFSRGESYAQKNIKTILASGTLVPEPIMVSLWAAYLNDNFTGSENLVFDGTPRKLREAELLDEALKFYNFKETTVIYVNVSREWSEKRLAGRARKDDTPEAIERRLAWFDTEVTQVIDFYRNSSYYNFININGEQPIQEVQNEILAKLGLNL